MKIFFEENEELKWTACKLFDDDGELLEHIVIYIGRKKPVVDCKEGDLFRVRAENYKTSERREKDLVWKLYWKYRCKVLSKHDPHDSEILDKVCNLYYSYLH